VQQLSTPVQTATCLGEKCLKASTPCRRTQLQPDKAEAVLVRKHGYQKYLGWCVPVPETAAAAGVLLLLLMHGCRRLCISYGRNHTTCCHLLLQTPVTLKVGKSAMRCGHVPSPLSTRLCLRLLGSGVPWLLVRVASRQDSVAICKHKPDRTRAVWWAQIPCRPDPEPWDSSQGQSAAAQLTACAATAAVVLVRVGHGVCCSSRVGGALVAPCTV